ncbi:MAG: hypothetical protein N2Z65_05900 [Clostridiales bacterium]|nr:hypothetical protein [Clostridiales bacterium]
MKKRFTILCVLFIFLVGCKYTLEKSTDVVSPKEDTVIKDQQVFSESSKEGNIKKDSDSEPYFNEVLQRYEIVDGYSDGFLEIMDEKISYNGNGYQDIASPLHERIMFNAVRFYMAATSSDFDTIKKMAGRELISEMGKTLTTDGDKSFIYGGNEVISLKDLSIYKKPISITAPTKIDENKYKVSLEYSNKNGNHFIETILKVQSNEIKIISFLKRT